MSEVDNKTTITLELTTAELAAIYSSTLSTYLCSMAAADPSAVKAYEFIHQLSHHTLAASPQVLAKMREAAGPTAATFAAEHPEENARLNRLADSLMQPPVDPRLN